MALVTLKKLAEGIMRLDWLTATGEVGAPWIKYIKRLTAVFAQAITAYDNEMCVATIAPLNPRSDGMSEVYLTADLLERTIGALAAIERRIDIVTDGRKGQR
jgi:hypothetical protein